MKQKPEFIQSLMKHVATSPTVVDLLLKLFISDEYQDDDQVSKVCIYLFIELVNNHTSLVEKCFYSV